MPENSWHLGQFSIGSQETWQLIAEMLARDSPSHIFALWRHPRRRRQELLEAKQSSIPEVACGSRYWTMIWRAIQAHLLRELWIVGKMQKSERISMNWYCVWPKAWIKHWLSRRYQLSACLIQGNSTTSLHNEWELHCKRLQSIPMPWKFSTSANLRAGW